MIHSAWLLSLLFFFATSVAASGDDRQKAERQTRKITAMATDKTGRQMVSMSVADTFKVSRSDLVKQRRRIGIDYGGFFVVQEFLAGGIDLTEILSELKAGKTIWQIGNERHADWRKIAADAKKQNTRIEDYIYRHFLNKKNFDADQERDLADKYDIRQDAVQTDFNISDQEIIEAQERYIFWRDEAGKMQGPSGFMTPAQRMAASLDHTAAVHDKSGGTSAPAAGGLPH